MQPAFLPHLPVRPSSLLRDTFRSTFRSPHSACPRNISTTSTMSATPPASLGVSKILFAKAAPDGTLGDCPFTQKANLALNFQSVSFSVHPIDLSNKPQWFLDLNEAGTTPVFVDATHAIGESDEIVEYADKLSQRVPLVRDNDNNWDPAFDRVSPVFGALVRLLKNKEHAKEPALREELTNVLRHLNDFLAQVEGNFLLGEHVSALDCNLMPKLHHLSVAASHYKNYTIPPEFSNLLAYIEHFKTTDAWRNTTCPDDVIIWGWSKFFP